MIITNPANNQPISATQLLLDNIALYYMNPSSIQQNILDVLELCLAGNDIVDVTNPFIFLMEASATAVAGAISSGESVTRKLYPPLAQSMNELYRHMSDKDYIGIFSTGASTTITMLVPYQELMAAAIYINNSTTVRSVVIPRNTQINADGVSLIVGYPIQINILGFNVIQVLYDTTITNPLMPLTTNVLVSNLITYNGLEYLQVEVPVKQYTNISNVFTLNNTSSFTQTIPFADQYAYTRAFINNKNGVWQEILTTHSPIVYDITKPTLKLQLNGNNLTAVLPDIYQSLNTAGVSIRIDIYSCKGVMDSDLSQLSTTNFTSTWIDFDTLNINPGVAPLNNINDIIYYATGFLLGGSNMATIEEMRNKVIYHADTTQVPIRPTDISIDLSTLGYTVQKVIDSVTNRVFIASKNLPLRVVDNLSIVPLASNVTVSFDVTKGMIGGGYQQSIITHSAPRATVMPAALYLNNGGNITLMTDAQLNQIASLGAADLVNKINAGMYLYSPFHYVIDYTESVMDVRAYYLSAPSILGRAFVASNLNRSYNIVTVDATISLTPNGYELIISATIPTGITGVVCQLSYNNPASGETIFLNGTPNIMASTATFTFELNTNFDISQFDEIEIMNMINILSKESPLYLNINSTFNLFYLVTGSNVGLTTSFDNLYLTSASMQPVIGATYETINIEFGKALPNLYHPSKSIVQAGTFQTYTADVPATYQNTVYKQGPNGYLYTVNTDGTINFLIQNNIGDPVLNTQGLPVLLHKAGDFVLDANGNTIPTTNYVNSVIYQVGMTLVDASYRFGTTAAVQQYAKTIPNNIIGYLEQEIIPLAGTLNERTKLYYKPMSEASYIDVLIGNGVTQTVPSILNIQITYYLTQAGIDSPSIIDSIKRMTRSVLSAQVQLSVLSVTSLTTALQAAAPSQVTAFSIDSYLPNNLPLVAIVDPSSTFTIGEELSLLPDGTIDVVSTINIKFNTAT